MFIKPNFPTGTKTINPPAQPHTPPPPPPLRFPSPISRRPPCPPLSPPLTPPSHLAPSIFPHFLSFRNGSYRLRSLFAPPTLLRPGLTPLPPSFKPPVSLHPPHPPATPHPARPPHPNLPSPSVRFHPPPHLLPGFPQSPP